MNDCTFSSFTYCNISTLAQLPPARYRLRGTCVRRFAPQYKKGGEAGLAGQRRVAGAWGNLCRFAGSSRYQYFVGRRDDAYHKSSDLLFSHSIKFNATCAG